MTSPNALAWEALDNWPADRARDPRVFRAVHGRRLEYFAATRETIEWLVGRGGDLDALFSEALPSLQAVAGDHYDGRRTSWAAPFVVTRDMLALDLDDAEAA